MTSPAMHLKDILVANAVGTFAGTTGWGIYIGSQPDKPNDVITLYDYGGANSWAKWLFDEPNVQIRVRSRNYSLAYDRCRLVKNLLHSRTPYTAPNGDKIVSFLLQGDINFLKFDENKRAEFTLNFALRMEPADIAGNFRDPL